MGTTDNDRRAVEENICPSWAVGIIVIDLFDSHCHRVLLRKSEVRKCSNCFVGRHGEMALLNAVTQEEVNSSITRYVTSRIS